MDFSKINELKPYDLNCNIFDVYSYNGLSMQELLCQFFTKINECVKTSNETIDLAEWLVNEGLRQEVALKLTEWLNDGTFENLINVTLFENLNKKIDNASSQLEQNITVLDNNTINDTENLINAINIAKNTSKKVLIDRILNIDGFVEIPKCVELEFKNDSYLNVLEFDISTQKGGWVYFNNPSYPIKPEFFGAKGDGVTDDTKAIQNAIDSNLNPNIFPIGKTQNEVGKSHIGYNSIRVEFSPREYLISKPLIIRAEQHFNGILFTSSQPNFYKAQISGINKTKPYIENCIILETPDDYPKGDQDSQTDKQFTNISFSRFQTVLNIGRIDNYGLIQNCRFEDITTRAIYLNQVNNFSVLNNLMVSSSNAYLVDCYYSNYVNIGFNIIGEAEGACKGVYVDNGSMSTVKIFDNNFRDGQITIADRSKSFVDISNNSFNAKNNTSEPAIIINDNSKHIIVKGNTFKGFKTGISTLNNTFISNNYFYNCIIGVEIRNNGVSNKVTNNSFAGGSFGVSFGVNSTNNTIDCNNFSYVEQVFYSGERGVTNNFINGNNFADYTTLHNFTSDQYYGLNCKKGVGVIDSTI